MRNLIAIIDVERILRNQEWDLFHQISESMEFNGIDLDQNRCLLRRIELLDPISRSERATNIYWVKLPGLLQGA